MTTIEWTDKTWNPTTGCDRVSPGCNNCYALSLAPRLKAMGSAKYQTDGDPRTSGPGFGLAIHPDTLDHPLQWRKPRRVFVNSMSDLFHPQVPSQFIEQVFAVMAAAPQHTFQVLTKRPARMRAMLGSTGFWLGVVIATDNLHINHGRYVGVDAPLPNVWLGTSVEDQKRADERIPLLLDTPAAVRFLSCEPLLGPVDLSRWMGGFCDHQPGVNCCGECHCESNDGHAKLDWVIVGGESGSNARPINPEWVRGLRDQCVSADLPFFFKQWGGRTPKAGGRELDGRTWGEYPDGAP